MQIIDQTCPTRKFSGGAFFCYPPERKGRRLNKLLFLALGAAVGLACTVPTGAALIANRATATAAATSKPTAYQAIVTPSPTPQATKQVSATAEPFCTVTAARYLFIRRGPGRDTGAIGYAHNGERLALLEPGENWHKVTTAAGIGFVSKFYCEVTE